jgi:hypothetical protein
VGSPVLCDIGYLKFGDSFLITTYVVPNNFDRTIRARESTLMLVRAEADNAISNELWIQVSWDGQWADGDYEMQSHLVVREVSQKDIVALLPPEELSG